MSKETKHDRRRFLRNAAATIAAAKLGTIGSADAQTINLTPIERATHTSFGSLKQIDAGLLNNRIRRSRPSQWPYGHPAARVALRHLQLCRCRAFIGIGGLPADRPVSAWLWPDALSFK